ncbi:MAG: glycosyltransferase, partial [Prevotellaceae bacterium]|nr:glycosyltransferase [Prevotellaceae bacterium]
KVSIVITAYNVGGFIRQAVESALCQTHPETEVVVVEDCPTDNTDTVLRQLERENTDRLRVVRNPKNQGAGMSRRIGIENSTGDYVLLLDGDDWLKPDFVERLLSKSKGEDIISGGITVLPDDGGYEITSYGDKVNEGIDRIRGHFGERIIFMNNKLIRRSLYNQVPYCGRRYIEDTPTIVPLLYLANKVRYVDEVGYMYRMRTGSLTHEATDLKNALFRALCVKDLIEWFKDKPREYRDLFRRSQFIQLAAQIERQPEEAKKQAPSLYPKEWREFAQYLSELLELRDSILK